MLAFTDIDLVPPRPPLPIPPNPLYLPLPPNPRHAPVILPLAHRQLHGR